MPLDTKTLPGSADISLKQSLAIKEAKQTDHMKDNLEKLRKEYETLSREYNNKAKAVEYLVIEHRQQQSNLEGIKEKIKAERDAEYRNLQSAQDKVARADDRYRKLNLALDEALQAINHERLELTEKERLFTTRANTLEKQVKNAEQHSTDVITDVLAFQELLEEREAEFEKLRIEFEPNLLMVSGIKNQNKNLLAKIEKDKQLHESRLASFETEKIRHQAEVDVERERVNNYELTLQNEKQKLEKFEQELKDKQLEIEVARKRVNDDIKRHKLSEELKDGE